MQLNSLDNLFADQLRDLYSPENQSLEAQPKKVQADTSSALKQAFEHHLQQSQEHVHRLDRIFASLDYGHMNETCEAMKGLLKEGEEVIQAQGDSAVKDAALIAAAQRVEHYEMAGYGTVRTYAKELGYSDAEDLLQKTLDEEGEANKKLTKLAEGNFFDSGINQEAMR
jgi:ferritin-like metal-binding protein YciE